MFGMFFYSYVHGLVRPFYSRKFRAVVFCLFLNGALFAEIADFDIPDFRKKSNRSIKYASYVNPFIGTGGHGHTFPGAVAPFGMVQLSPDTRNDASWDACGGYYYHDSFTYGFSHTHLSGTGVSDLGDVLFQPIDKPKFNPEKYKQRFIHEQEQASVGYYKVQYPDMGVQIELTATEYSGIQRYVFPNNDSIKWVLIDLKHRDKLLSSSLQIQNPNTLIGHRQSQQWANNQWVYFVTRFSQKISGWQFNEDSTQLALGFYLINDTIDIQTTLSFTSLEGAFVNERSQLSKFNFQNKRIDIGLDHPKAIPGRNKSSDIKSHQILSRPGWENFSDFEMLDFQSVREAYEQLWDSELSRIKIHDRNPNPQEMSTFYTALYHCMIHPSLASDADGRYRGRDQKVHQTAHKTYHVFSLWDTYRALHPLLSLIDKSRTRDFILTMLDQYEEGGRLPVWELGSCETNCMIGFHSVPVILDAVVQGIYFSGEEQERLWGAVKHSSDYKELSFEYHIPIARELLTLYGLKLGYIDVLNQSESVSKTLEYAFDDACVAKLGRLWGYEAEAREYENRSQRWRGLWDPVTKSFRPRTNGMFLDPFYLNEVNNHYTEANAWQYRFAVQHDIEGLIAHFGGADSFERALDLLFNGSTLTRGREQADISGLIGQYAHGNEPSHHMAYLYNYVGKPEKAQRLISKIQEEFYTIGPDGYIGNEDCGQMSAWHVLSALGMYPVAPGSGYWDLGVPMFDSVEVFQSDAKHIRISRSNGFNGPNAHRMNMPHYQYLEYDQAPWVVSETYAERVYKQKFVELTPNYSQLLPKNNRMSNDFLMIHRSVHFEKNLNGGDLDRLAKFPSKPINSEQKRELESARIVKKDYVPELISPGKINRGEAYTVHIKGATKSQPVAVFIRFMDSNLVFGEAREAFYKRFKEVRTAEGLMRIPGYAAHHRLLLAESDTLINLKGSALVWAAFMERDSWVGKPFVARYIHEKSNDFEVKEIKGNYNPQYSGGGDGALVDGVLGSEEWRSGFWQGYQAQDFETVIDLKTITHIDYLGARFLSDERAWIFLPTKVEWEYSKDGIEYKPFNTFEFKRDAPREDIMINPIIMGHKKKRKGIDARFIKVKAKNFGKLPQGHPGFDYNGDAFIFIDEVLINPEVMTLE